MPFGTILPAGRTMEVAANPTDATVPGNSVIGPGGITPANPLTWQNDTPLIVEIFPAAGAKLTCQVHAIGAAGQVGIVQVSGTTQGGPVVAGQLEITITPGPLARFNPVFTLLP